MALNFKKQTTFESEEVNFILLDSDALIALINEEDEFHKRAVKIRDELLKVGDIFVISRYIIAETATFLTLRVNKETANRFLKDLDREKINIIETNGELEELAKEYFLKQKSHKVTYFDCVNMAILTRYKWRIIFSFDKHYKQNNFVLAQETLRGN